jgi:hypothetical protein
MGLVYTLTIPPPLLCSSLHDCRDVKRALLDADVNLKVTNTLIQAVKEKAIGACVNSLPWWVLLEGSLT